MSETLGPAPHADRHMLPPEDMSETFGPAPHADRHMLQSEDLRRRQLRSALLHGSGRSWRERQRIWPAALAGVVVVAVILAVIGVYGAFQRQRTILDEEEQRRRQPAAASTGYHEKPESRKSRSGQ